MQGAGSRERGDYRKFLQIAQINKEKDIEICENQWNLRETLRNLWEMLYWN
jgi:hypothetical protein